MSSAQGSRRERDELDNNTDDDDDVPLLYLSTIKRVKGEPDRDCRQRCSALGPAEPTTASDAPGAAARAAWVAPPEWRKGTARYRRRAGTPHDQVLGEGAYAKVVIVLDLVSKTNRARKRQAYDDVPAWQLLCEIRTLQRAQGHRGIVELLDVCHRPGVVDLIMPVCWGSLQDLIEVHPGGLQCDTVRNLSVQLFSAVAHIHQQGIAHRDLKPANLLIAEDGVLKVADFGLAADVGEGKGSAYSVGTPGYCAPESMMGCLLPTFAVDVWGSGCVVAEMFLGKPLFTSGTEETIIKDILRFLGHSGGPLYPKKQFVENSDLPDVWASQKADHPSRLKHLPRPAVDLILSMLVLEPKKRRHMSALLLHVFFTGLSLPRSSLQVHRPSGT
ncbi:Cyclin-dependent kinase 20 [Tilletia horrida]|nr:Cyclin-dependent kinase 20 [Tilletia horrida]